MLRSNFFVISSLKIGRLSFTCNLSFASEPQEDLFAPEGFLTPFPVIPILEYMCVLPAQNEGDSIHKSSSQNNHQRLVKLAVES